MLKANQERNINCLYSQCKLLASGNHRGLAICWLELELNELSFLASLNSQSLSVSLGSLGLTKRKEEGLGTIGVGKDYQVSEHAAFLVIEAEELVDTGYRDFTQNPN